MRRGNLLAFTVLALMTTMILPVSAAPLTRAGTIITNQAEVDFKNLGGEAFQVISSIIETTVSVIPGVDITEGMLKSGKPGDTVVFTHTLTNTGNAPDIISVIVLSTDDFPFEALVDIDNDLAPTDADTQFMDNNLDGIPDTGQLEPGQSLTFFIKIIVPSDAALSVEAKYKTILTSGIDTSVTGSSEDAISIDQALPYIDLHDSAQYAYLGTEYEFKVSYGNDGDISFDGAILRVPLPAALEFVSAEGYWSYDAVGRIVVWNLGSITAGTSDTFTVRVRVISAGLGVTYVLNTAILTSDDGTYIEASELTGLITGAPVAITLVAEPDVIAGDGISRSFLTATVLDMLGSPVPDGTPVIFSTEAGFFLPNGLTDYTTTTTDGIAQVTLISPLLYRLEPVSNLVDVSAGTEATGKVYDSILIIFSPTGVIGVIWNGGTDEAVSDVFVELVDGFGTVVNSTHTNDEGRYLLTAPMVGSYIVRAHTTGIDPKGSIEMSVMVEQLQGAVWSTQCAILGAVQIDASGAGAGAAVLPTTDVEIYLYKEGDLVARTISDEYGEFKLLNLPEGDYLIKAITDEGSIAYKGVKLDNQGEILIANLLQLHSPGKVYDASNFAPISGADVTLLYASGPLAGTPVSLPATSLLPSQDNPMHSDAYGHYIFFEQPGEYVLKAEAFGYTDYLSNPFVSEGPVVNSGIPMLSVPSTQLSILKSSDRKTAAQGENVRFTITWANTSRSGQMGLTLVDVLPDGIIVDEPSISGDGTYDEVKRTITWSYDNVDASSGNRSETFTAAVETNVEDGMLLLNRAEISTEGGAHASSSAMVLIARHPCMDITKEAASANASTGEMVTYRITVANSADASTPMPANDVCVTDTLPFGFVYVQGSSRINSIPSTDPSIKGREISWHLGDMAVGTSNEIMYKTSVGAGALRGDAINTAIVSGMGEYGYPFEAGPASARVALTGPAISSFGTILGKVFNDKNSNGAQDPDELGIADVELVTDDGIRVLTDEQGLYHISQLKPGIRSIKLNRNSLPEGSEITNSYDDFMGISPSFFVNVFPSGAARADFAVTLPGKSVSKALNITMTLPETTMVEGGSARISTVLELTNTDGVNSGALEVFVKGITSETGTRMLIEGSPFSVGDIAPGNLVQIPVDILVEGIQGKYSSLLVGAAVSTATKGEAGYIKLLGSTSVVSVLHTTRPDPSTEGYVIMLPSPVSVAYVGHITIRTEAPIDRETKLLVNGRQLSDDKIGSIIRNGIKGTTIVEYISVSLEQGENILELLDADTDKQVSSAIVMLPGQAVTSIAMRTPSGEGLNIGSSIAVSALVLDEMSLPAGKSSGLTVFATGADFRGIDIDYSKDGFQLAGEERGNFNLILSITDDMAEVSVRTLVGNESKYIEVNDLAPRERPVFISGTIELSHNLKKFTSSYIKARAFLRKEFTGGVLTLRYDGERMTGDGTYENQETGYLYDLHGDGSEQKDTGPSSSPFYASLATKHFSAVWGDLQPAYEGIELSSFRSKMTGFYTSLNLGQFGLSGFIAPQREGTSTERLDGNGTSGYFLLGAYPVIPGSETIYVIRTSSYNNRNILERVLLTRNLDYRIEYQTGAILLARPLPSYDEEGNSYHLEVSYATTGGSIEEIAAGARVKVHLGPLALGITTAIKAKEGDTDVVVGADADLSLGSILRLFAETASSFDSTIFRGYAIKAGAEVKLGSIMAKLETMASDGGFVMPGETTPLPGQITLYAKAGIEESSDLILTLMTSNTWKGASFDYSCDNKLTVGYQLPLPIGLSIGMTTTFTYEGVTSANGATFDIFAMAEPIPQFSIKANAQLAKIGSPLDDDGDYSLSISYKPGSKLALTMAYITGTELAGRYHTLSLTADLSVTSNGKLYGTLSLPFGSKASRTLGLGYKDALQLSKGLKANIAVEGVIGFEPNGALSFETSKAAASASLEYAATNGFRANMKQEFSCAAAGLTSLTLVDISGKATEWLSMQADAACYYGSTPNRDGLPLRAEASLALAVRPDNTVLTGLLKMEGRYFTGERFGHRENAVIATASTDWTFDPGKYMSITAKAGYKLSAEATLGEVMGTSQLLLMQAGVSFHITRTTNGEVFLRSIGWSESWKTGYCVQLVQKVFNPLSFVLGYNSKDLSDTDIKDAKPWQEGFYLKALMKF